MNNNSYSSACSSVMTHPPSLEKSRVAAVSPKTSASFTRRAFFKNEIVSSDKQPPSLPAAAANNSNESKKHIVDLLQSPATVLRSKKQQTLEQKVKSDIKAKVNGLVLDDNDDAARGGKRKSSAMGGSKAAKKKDDVDRFFSSDDDDGKSGLLSSPTTRRFSSKNKRSDGSSSTSSSEETLSDDDKNIKNVFNSKKMRNKFLSKLLLKSKKKVVKYGTCLFTPFLLAKLAFSIF